MTFKIEPLAPFGAAIEGVSLRNLSDHAKEAMRDAFREHGLIFFRGQTLSELDHITLAEIWGEININRFFIPHPVHRQIALVIKEPDQLGNIGGNWHTDHSYDLVPALGSMLVARQLPPQGGGTNFASMYLAHDALPQALRTRLDGLEAVHSAHRVFGSLADALIDVVHPVIIRHPLSGKPSLYVNPEFTVRILGVSEAESADLLARLFEHGQNPDFVHEFQWQEGSIAFWDNRATWHFAQNDYHGYRREMHRITIEGEPIAGSRFASAAELEMLAAMA